MHPPLTVYLALGSNLGNRRGHLARGIGSLARGGVDIGEISPLVETPPVGYQDQPDFLNLVLGGRWKGGASELFRVMMGVEEESGRMRPFPGAPRTLDVDLIFFGTRIVRTGELWVPHPRWRTRTFVARPLAAIAPGFLDPETGWRVEEVARLWPGEPEVIRVLDEDLFHA